MANLGNIQRHLGQFADALAPTQETVTIRRRLALEDRAFRLDLAIGLNNLAALYDDLGQYDEAIEAAKDAIGHVGEASADPMECQLILAHILNNLASTLSPLERREEAFKAQQKAAFHFRQLAAARPDAFQAEAALAIHNLALLSSDLGWHREAIQAVQEAVASLRELAGERPEVFLTDVALPLYNSSEIFGNAKQPGKARQVLEESIEIWRRSMDWRPQDGAKLAEALLVRGHHQLAAERGEDALEDYRQAVDLLRELDRQSPGVYRSELASTLLAVGRQLLKMDVSMRPPELAGCVEEGLEMMVSFAEEHPESHREQRASPLATSLLSFLESGSLDSNLAAVLARLSKEEGGE